MLTTAEYRHIIRNRAALQNQIDDAERAKEHYDGLKKEAQARKEAFEPEMAFYANYLHEAIQEYETAHPVEE